MSRARSTATTDRPRLTVAVLALGTGAFAVANVIGADARWLAALGRTVVRDGIPDGVPYAAASSDGWHNVPVLGEIVFYLVDAALLDRGLQLAQVVAVALCLGLLAAAMLHAGATDAGAALALTLVAVGSISTFGAVRRAALLAGALLAAARAAAR